MIKSIQYPCSMVQCNFWWFDARSLIKQSQGWTMLHRIISSSLAFSPAFEWRITIHILYMDTLGTYISNLQYPIGSISLANPFDSQWTSPFFLPITLKRTIPRRPMRLGLLRNQASFFSHRKTSNKYHWYPMNLPFIACSYLILSLGCWWLKNHSSMGINSWMFIYG